MNLKAHSPVPGWNRCEISGRFRDTQKEGESERKKTEDGKYRGIFFILF
jgi:hypothetical protein